MSDASLPDEARVGIKPERVDGVLSFLEEFVAHFRDERRPFYATQEDGPKMPAEVEINWSLPIEIAWKRVEDERQAAGYITLAPYDRNTTTSFAFVKRADGGLRYIGFIPPISFTKDGQFEPSQGSAEFFEASFANAIGHLEFFASNERIMKEGLYRTSEINDFINSKGGHFDPRIIGGGSLDLYISTSCTTYK